MCWDGDEGKEGLGGREGGKNVAGKRGKERAGRGKEDVG